MYTYKTKRTEIEYLKEVIYQLFQQAFTEHSFMPGTVLSHENSSVNRTNFDASWSM